MKYNKKYLKEINEWLAEDSNESFLSRHPEIERFDMPKTFYFRYLPYRGELHWAIIKHDDKCAYVYFINSWGRVFDKLEYKNKKIAKRRLRRNGFEFSTNRFCPFMPPEPIYIQLSCGKKSAPYSKGNLWHSVQRNKKHIDKIEKKYFKQMTTYYEKRKNLVFYGKWAVTSQEENIQTTSVKNVKKTTSNSGNLFIKFLNWLAIIITIMIIIGEMGK